jgi:lipopolysaccharide/colanic/teichoic acid biosynthesis glycosyltransferase
LRIDELPQIFNVLRGEMSFVGPRPERPFFVQELSQEIPYYNTRHSIKPGITGWAQVRYPYGASLEDSVEKLQYDLYYVKNHTLFLDIMILIETVQVVLWGKGAR